MRARAILAVTLALVLARGVLFPAPVHAQAGVGFAHQVNLTVTNAAVVQLTIPIGTTYCVVSIGVNPINWVDDAAAPAVTTTTGIPAAANAILSFAGYLNCLNFRMIAQAGNATINSQYYR